MELTLAISFRLSASALTASLREATRSRVRSATLFSSCCLDWSSATDISPIEACSSPISPPVVTGRSSCKRPLRICRRAPIADRKGDVRLRARYRAKAAETSKASAAMPSSI